ncbi:MAG: hypothetical protein ACLPWF_27940 [Bryobacteraceae bacterium]
MTDDELDRRLRESILSEELDASRLELALRNRIQTNRRTVPGWAIGAAAVIAMVAASALSYRTFRAEQAPPPLCIAAARDHRTEIVNGEPRRWLTDPSGIQSLARKQGVSPSAIAALGTTGYRLERGRLCFLQKQIFLHLVYIKSGSEYSVYLRPRTDEASFSDSVRGAENLAYFQTKRITAVFVSHAADADAMAFARTSRKVL